nr:retrovirus-related Pol polyprotein from transposon TNT 1-94 [Tanacetum cinerariifolium]
MLLMQAHENRVALDKEQLLFIVGGQDNVVDEDVDEQPVQDLALNVDKVFQDDDCDAFDFDVDEAPTSHAMFMANLSSTDHVYDEVGSSYDSDILSELHDHDHYQDAICEHHEYVKDNAVLVVQNSITLKVLAPGMYAIDVEPIPHCLRNNREVHLDYLKHLKESVKTLHEIVEEAKVDRPLDRSLASACLYTKHSLELLEYVIGTCPKDFNK